MDNLYLDMNGIIHNCTHGNDPNVKLTEEEMIIKIFDYIDRLFKIVQPRKLLFAAIDGAALGHISHSAPSVLCHSPCVYI